MHSSKYTHDGGMEQVAAPQSTLLLAARSSHLVVAIAGGPAARDKGLVQVKDLRKNKIVLLFFNSTNKIH